MSEPSMQDRTHRRYTARELETQYNARAAVPEYPAIAADWDARSRRLRETQTCRLDLAYGPGERHRLDVFQCGTAGAALYVYIHGGYWQRGDKSGYSFVAQSLLANGIDVALINYGLCPATRFDAVVSDAREAVAWLWRNADELGFDRDALHVTGHSAGGHLTAMLLAADWPAVGTDLPADLVKSGLAISGLYELEPLRPTSINEALHLDEETARRHSPIYLRPGTRAPLTLAVGGAESDEFHRQADVLAAAWRAHGSTVGILDVPGLNHFTIVESLASEDGSLLGEAIRLRSESAGKRDA